MLTFYSRNTSYGREKEVGIYCRKDGEEEILPLKLLYNVDELAKEILIEEREEEEEQESKT